MQAFAFLQNFKKRLATIDPTSWHYRLVDLVWDGPVMPRKACTYWWFYVGGIPVRIVGVAVYVLFLVLVMGLFVLFFAGIGWFLGFWIRFDDQWGQEKDLYYPYKMRPKKPWDSRSGLVRQRIVPWEFSLIAGAMGGTVYLAVWHSAFALTIAPYAGMALGGLFVVSLIVFSVARGLRASFVKNAKAQFKAAWDKACPEVTYVSEKNIEDNNPHGLEKFGS